MTESIAEVKSSKTTEREVCAECIGDGYLRKVVKRFGKDSTCLYCHSSSKTIKLENLSKHIRKFFDNYFIYNKNESTQPMFDFMYNAGGSVKFIIQKHARVDKDISTDLQNELKSMSLNRKGANSKPVNIYDEFARYNENQINSQYWDSLWGKLEKTIMEENRMFNSKAQKILKSVFFDIIKTNDDKYENGFTVTEIGPGTSIDNVFRAREFQSEEVLEMALKNPDVELGPPPSKNSTEGRMNARGVSMFYSAISSDIAIAEIRPTVGSNVIVANFYITRRLKLLNVSKLKSALVTRSRFMPSQKRILEKRKFISSLSRQISAPVMTVDQSISYLATQAISDYLSELTYPTTIDGIIYDSAQKGIESGNIVLFHKSCRVKLEDTLERSERLRKLEKQRKSERSEMLTLRRREYREMQARSRSAVTNDKDKPDNGDDREPSLSLDRGNVSVHFIKSVNFETDKKKNRGHASYPLKY